MKKTILASQARYDYIKIIKLIILIEGSFSKIVFNTYMKCNNIPLLWRKFFLNIANNRVYVFEYCNRTFRNFRRHCREWCLYNNPDDDEIRKLNDERNSYGAYWM